MADQTGRKSLQEVLDAAGNVVDYLWSHPKGNASGLMKRWQPWVVPVEVTNWRREQEAWSEAVVLFDQTYHMPELHLHGQNPLAVLAPLFVNNLSRVTPGASRHMLSCTPRGHVIGDDILYCFDEHHVALISSEPIQNWVQYHLEKEKPPVTWELDESWPRNPRGYRHFYRYEIAGPAVPDLMERLTGTKVEIPYFRHAVLTMHGHAVRALHHNMAGVPGFELSGPWEEREAVKALLLREGEAFGIRHAGSLAYTTASMESGWIPSPLPGIYSDPDLRAYREWLPGDGFEARGSLGGSYYSPNIEDYYLTPWDLSYDHLIKFDHDFVGRAALEEMAQRPHRRRVTLVWNPADVLKVIETYLHPGLPALFLEWPVLWHGWRYDKVLNAHGELVGLGIGKTAYSINERAFLTLAAVDEQWSRPGTELTLIWGEDPERQAHSGVEPHQQLPVRVTVAPSPIGQLARHHRAEVSGHTAG
ncbi:MAG: aminomethyl transferase family protein [Firmicutes bacterium]|nr:aminomethyl transferase family protein [Alicyclobacillaceae bacterium]MCL6497875.1 aminomethyl transferase family protein [Bacillota bacterium]